MGKQKKSLKQKFLDGDKLNLLEDIQIGLLQRLTDCDVMCYKVNCDAWYCHTYRIKQSNYQIA